jgi:hypothetical protein
MSELVTVIAVIASPVAALLGIRWTLANQRRQATLQDQRNQRDARLARSRESLGHLLAVALQLEFFVDEPIVVDREMRDSMRKAQQALADNWSRNLEARGKILAEPDGLKWAGEFETLVLHPYRRFRMAVGDGKQDPREEREALKAGVQRFRAAVVAHLAALEQPI